MSSSHWNIISSWSKAGIGTSIVLELNNNLRSSGSEPKNHNNSSTKTHRIVFDIGATPSFGDAISAKYVFVSHGHLDHVGALFGHARAHAVAFGGAAATYFVPAQLLSRIEQCRDAMSNLDATTNIDPLQDESRSTTTTRKKSLLKMNLVPVHDGDEIPLKGIHYDSKTSFFMRAFSVDHAGHPALAYVIGSRTTSGLREEYQHLDNEEMRKLIKSGVSVKVDPVEKIEIAYTGDTCVNGLINKLPQPPNSIVSNNNICEKVKGIASPSYCDSIGQLFQAELLLCELTFLDSSENEDQRSKAIERGHIHINDLERIFSSHINTWWDDEENLECDNYDTLTDRQKKKKIVYYHLSAKYQPAMRALDLIIEGLPSRLLRYYDCYVSIYSMLDDSLKMRDPEQIINGPDDEMRKLFLPRSGCISIERYRSWKNRHVVA